MNLRHPACKASALPLSYPPEGLRVVAAFGLAGKRRAIFAHFAGEQFTRPKLEFTLIELPDAVYFEQPKPSMQNICESQSTENEFEPKSKAQPVFEVAARTKLSALPFTVQLSLALLQIGQAYVIVLLLAPPVLVPSLSTTPPHAPTEPKNRAQKPNPESHRTTLQ